MFVDISTREEQLPWFNEPVIIQQDWELIKYIQDNKISHALLLGDSDFFKQHVDFSYKESVDFVIWIQNSPFRFDKLLQDINLVIDKKLNSNGILYIAINKFLCLPDCYNANLDNNYETAILQYVKQHVLADIVNYFPDTDTNGISFNWAHPLTRFYLKKAQ
jgi:hypothetical protein